MLKKVQPGDRLRIPAGEFNTFIDAARDFQNRQRQMTRERQRGVNQSHLILVRNDSGSDRERFHLLEISAPLIMPNDNQAAFIERVAVSGIAPTVDRGGKFVVLLEPLKEGVIGQACITGACMVRVEMVDEGHAFADAAEGRMDALVSGPSGAAQLLWVQPVEQRDESGIAWAVARLGLPASRSAVMAVVIACNYDEVSLSLRVTCSRLLATDYDYEPEPEANDTFVAWAGIDPLIVVDHIVCLIPITPMPSEPDIGYFAIPMLSAPRTLIDMPDDACSTEYSEPCAPQQSSELCVPE